MGLVVSRIQPKNFATQRRGSEKALSYAFHNLAFWYGAWTQKSRSALEDSTSAAKLKRYRRNIAIALGRPRILRYCASSILGNPPERTCRALLKIAGSRHPSRGVGLHRNPTIAIVSSTACMPLPREERWKFEPRSLSRLFPGAAAPLLIAADPTL